MFEAFLNLLLRNVLEVKQRLRMCEAPEHIVEERRGRGENCLVSRSHRGSTKVFFTNELDISESLVLSELTERHFGFGLKFVVGKVEGTAVHS